MSSIILLLLCVIGLVLSAYSFYVYQRSIKNSKYRPICDLSKKISCTRAFLSEYGKTLGISNSLWGVAFYLLALMLITAGRVDIVFYLSVITVACSAYLAYVLYFRLKDFCIVCSAIYAINVLLLILSFFMHK